MDGRIEKWRSLLWTFCLLVASITGLSSSGCKYVPAKVAAPLPPASMDGNSALESGRKIYVSFLKCGLCHRPKPVYEYSVETWTQDILPRMSKKAHLSAKEYSDVLTYVTSNEAQNPPATSK